ncbi:MAG: translation initiation factor IF-3 [Kordiimonadaceae bacterium]|jgi:translation initiation factor IF-3|nr:translation initiation factor IF-3 [Kordiimonadaceae bacterium]MBT6036749.1 translation initiation factor IF-3 [Kordiimonadaceae bacterium]MBT6328371.1 translation initiation factor IF-3 [Kordiimonadaceae bacterium]
MQGPSSKKGPRVNSDIEDDEIRLIDETGENHGAVATEKAITMAKAAGLDLVEISPNATPPVCKILDYGKYKYEAQKKASLARKKQKTVDVKEIKLRPGIEKHDYDVKMRSIDKFLTAGDKVKVTLRYRGREMAHQEIGMDVLNRVREQFAEVTKIEQMPKMEGRQMIMIIAPK